MKSFKNHNISEASKFGVMNVASSCNVNPSPPIFITHADVWNTEFPYLPTAVFDIHCKHCINLNVLWVNVNVDYGSC